MRTRDGTVRLQCLWHEYDYCVIQGRIAEASRLRDEIESLIRKDEP